MSKLILVRHGESLANADNVYTGWNDVALSQKGRKQAKLAGKLICRLHFSPTMIHTSVLSRAIVTANIIAEQGHFLWVPISKTWRLNERHYGALKGMNKDYSKQKFGAEQVRLWRRSFTATPPALTSPIKDRRYAVIDPASLPLAESLKAAQSRLLPYFFDQIAPHLLANEDQLVVAHGSSLRALIKYLEQLSDQEIIDVEVPNATPIVYELGPNLQITDKQILN